MTIVEFLLARISEDEEAARAVRPLDHNYDMGGSRQDERFVFTRYLPDSMDGRGNWAKDDPATPAHFARHDPARVLAECEAKRRIVELHQNWPVLVERPPTFQPGLDADLVSSDSPTSFAMRASRQIAWMTEQEYRTRFGDEPPTAPMLRTLAAIWADHPDFSEDWRVA